MDAGQAVRTAPLLLRAGWLFPLRAEATQVVAVEAAAAAHHVPQFQAACLVHRINSIKKCMHPYFHA